jgi:hypothetical protein
MVAAARAGGAVSILDYDHTAAEWDPPPPTAGARFYEAFLAWRTEAGMDNAIGARLERMLRDAGLLDVTVLHSTEKPPQAPSTSRRGPRSGRRSRRRAGISWSL